VPLLAAAAGWSACVTTVVDEEPAAQPAAVGLEPVVLPLAAAAPGHSALNEYFLDVVAQMQEALQDKDLEHLLGLLATHERQDAPAWARQQMARFQTAALGLQFARHAAAHGTLALHGEAGLGIGARLDYELAVPALPNRAVRPGRDGLRFLATVKITDHDGQGARAERTSSTLVELDEPRRPPPWRAPFAVDAPAQGSVLRVVAVNIELLPGTIHIDGKATTLPRLELARHRVALYPAGYRPIEAQPLRTLRNAIALGDAEHFPHWYLAAHFMPQPDRPAAMDALISVVRLGSAEQARVAMACLQVLTGEELSVADREGWLEWWRQRG
jgi:hypothetical protein